MLICVVKSSFTTSKHGCYQKFMRFLMTLVKIVFLCNDFYDSTEEFKFHFLHPYPISFKMVECCMVYAMQCIALHHMHTTLSAQLVDSSFSLYTLYFYSFSFNFKYSQNIILAFKSGSYHHFLPASKLSSLGCLSSSSSSSSSIPSFPRNSNL